MIGKFIVWVYAFILNTPSHIVKSIFSNLILNIPLFFLFNHFINAFWSSIFFTIFVSFILSLLAEWRFYSESIRSTFDYTCYGFILSNLFSKYKKEGESFRTSLKIKIDGEYFRVIRFIKINLKDIKFNKKERQIDIPAGFLVIDSNNCPITDKEKIVKVLEIYNLWYYFYINPLFKDIKTNYFFLKNAIHFNDLMIKGINERKKEDYQKILKKSDEEYIKILKELDNQVINQSPFLQAKIKAQIELIKSLYTIWEYPSDKIYSRMEQLFVEIKENASKENNIWNVRLNYWHKLKEYQDKKIDKIKPEVRITKKTIILPFIELYLTQQIPFLGLILDKIWEISKYPVKWILGLFNKQIVYHQFGINAIRKNIELNQKLKEVSNVINKVKNEPTIRLSRNITE